MRAEPQLGERWADTLPMSNLATLGGVAAFWAGLQPGGPPVERIGRLGEEGEDRFGTADWLRPPPGEPFRFEDGVDFPGHPALRHGLTQVDERRFGQGNPQGGRQEARQQPPQDGVDAPPKTWPGQLELGKTCPRCGGGRFMCGCTGGVGSTPGISLDQLLLREGLAPGRSRPRPEVAPVVPREDVATTTALPRPPPGLRAFDTAAGTSAFPRAAAHRPLNDAPTIPLPLLSPRTSAGGWQAMA